MNDGTDLADAHRLQGNHVGRVLKGEKPSDLPVQQSTKVRLILNLKTAGTSRRPWCWASLSRWRCSAAPTR